MPAFSIGTQGDFNEEELKSIMVDVHTQTRSHRSYVKEYPTLQEGWCVGVTLRQWVPIEANNVVYLCPTFEDIKHILSIYNKGSAMDYSGIQWFAISCERELKKITKGDLLELLPKKCIPNEWDAIPAEHEVKLTIGEFLELLTGKSIQQKKAASSAASSSSSLFKPKEEPCVLIDDDNNYQHNDQFRIS